MSRNVTRVLIIGVVCGMRAALVPALVAHHLSRSRKPKLGRLEFMRSPTTVGVFKVAAVGELIGDKLPLAPARVAPGALSGRILAGALCGAALSRSVSERTAPSAAIGALGAAVGAYAFYELRKAVTQKGGLPDIAIALAEDALALTAGSAALRVRSFDDR